jgi:hypothetical protein
VETDLGAEAVVALPGNQFTTTAVRGDFLAPDDRVRTSLLVDYEMGGIASGDPSAGLQYQAWEGRVNAGTIQVRPDGAGAWTDVTTDSGITEIAIAFDQNMRATVAYVAAGSAKLYWYDATLPGFTTTTFAGATSPVVTMDDKRAAEVGLNDVLFFYIKAGRVCYRQQRDRYATERDLGAAPTGMTRILRWGFTNLFRVQLEFGVDADVGISTGPGASGYGGAYTDLLTDALYFVDSGAVVPMFKSAAAVSATWRSKKFILPTYPAVSWARVNGAAGGTFIVRVYGDGVLMGEATVAGKSPMRFKRARARLWEVEVQSDAQVTSVIVATSVEELLRVE